MNPRPRYAHTASEGLQKDIPCIGNQKKAGEAIHISDTIDFKLKTVIRDRKDNIQSPRYQSKKKI